MGAPLDAGVRMAVAALAWQLAIGVQMLQPVLWPTSVYAALEGVDLQLTVVVARLPQVGAQGTRFVFDVERAMLDGQAVTVPARVSMGWYRGAGGETLLAEAARSCAPASAGS